MFYEKMKNVLLSSHMIIKIKIIKMSSVYIYPLSYDTGFAPNPYAGILTFGCCMSNIRNVIKEGDILIGVGSKRLDNILNENGVELVESTDGRILYIAFITKKMSHKEYYKFVRQKGSGDMIMKIPSLKNKTGDSIYQFTEEGKIGLLPNLHLLKSWDNEEKLMTIVKDDISEDVLMSTHYLYFGDAFPDNTFQELDDILEFNKKIYVIGKYNMLSISEELKHKMFCYILKIINQTNKCMIGNPCSSYAKLDLTQKPKVVNFTE